MSASQMKNFFYFCNMDEEQITQMAKETGIDVKVLKQYINKLITEEGYDARSIKKKTQSVSRGSNTGVDAIYYNQKLNNEPVSKYVGDDIFYPFPTNDKGDKTGIDFGFGLKLKDKNGKFLYPEIANSDEDIARLTKDGMDEKEYMGHFYNVVKGKIKGAETKYNDHILKGDFDASRTFNKLNDYEKLLMADTNYNVGLKEFPMMMGHINANNLQGIGQEYKHFSNGQALGSRNEMRKSFLIKNLVMEKGYSGDKLETYMSNVANTGKGIFSQIGDYFDKNVKQPLYASDLPQVTLDIPFKDRSVTLGGQPAMEVPTPREDLNEYNDSRINQLSKEEIDPYGIN